MLGVLLVEAALLQTGQADFSKCVASGRFVVVGPEAWRASVLPAQQVALLTGTDLRRTVVDLSLAGEASVESLDLPSGGMPAGNHWWVKGRDGGEVMYDVWLETRDGGVAVHSTQSQSRCLPSQTCMRRGAVELRGRVLTTWIEDGGVQSARLAAIPRLESLLMTHAVMVSSGDYSRLSRYVDSATISPHERFDQLSV
jgi:hypothetical protein